MEWAVGKQGEMMRPDTGKLLLPGSKFRWDIHYSQAGEEITNQVEMGIYFYPKGQEPKFRTSLSLVPAALGDDGHAAEHGSPSREGFTMLRAGARIESFQRAHAPARQGDDDRSDPADAGRTQVLSLRQQLQLQLDDNSYVYADDVAPLVPKGTVLKITAWHDNTAAKKSNPDPNQWVGWGDRTVDEMAHAWVNITSYERRGPAGGNSEAPRCNAEQHSATAVRVLRGSQGFSRFSRFSTSSTQRTLSTSSTSRTPSVSIHSSAQPHPARRTQNEERLGSILWVCALCCRGRA